MTNQTGNLSSCGAGNPTPGAEAVRRAIHDWVREDAPLNQKMTWTPALNTALEERILAALPQAGEPSPAQEPVAWYRRDPRTGNINHLTLNNPTGGYEPLYTHPAPAQPDAGELREAVPESIKAVLDHFEFAKPNDLAFSISRFCKDPLFVRVGDLRTLCAALTGTQQAKGEDVLAGMINAAVDDLSIPEHWHDGCSPEQDRLIDAAFQRGVEAASDAIFAALMSETKG